MMVGMPASHAAFLMKLLRVDEFAMTLVGFSPAYLNARQIGDLSAAEDFIQNATSCQTRFWNLSSSFMQVKTSVAG
jgi:hypothetical protein